MDYYQLLKKSPSINKPLAGTPCRSSGRRINVSRCIIYQPRERILFCIRCVYTRFIKLFLFMRMCIHCDHVSDQKPRVAVKYKLMMSNADYDAQCRIIVQSLPERSGRQGQFICSCCTPKTCGFEMKGWI